MIPMGFAAHPREVAARRLLRQLRVGPTTLARCRISCPVPPAPTVRVRRKLPISFATPKIRIWSIDSLLNESAFGQPVKIRNLTHGSTREAFVPSPVCRTIAEGPVAILDQDLPWAAQTAGAYR